MTANELRKKYLDFFKSKGHAILPSASLIPENDPTVLFTTAGMHPLVPYLMGEKHPEGARLANIQKCIRTTDIEEAGDSTHHTFFEMLGNWSLGDYFKKETIEWSWEFLTSPDWLNLDKNLIAISVFQGDEDAAFDQEAFEIWKNLGVSEQRIARLPKSENWWGPAGKTGPCGPDTEMFYWVGDPNEVPENFNDDNDLWVEIWNDVFMQYNKKEDGGYELLKQKNVDTGMGMERTLAIMNGLDDNYLSELWIKTIEKIEELSRKKYDDTDDIRKVMRIIADHIKAATFIIGDDKGISPSNTDQGYIVRRLIRRAIRYSKQIGIEKKLWTKEIAEVIINDYKEAYPELEKNRIFIFYNLVDEEEKFTKTLDRGLKEMEKCNIDQGLNAEKAFYLYQTYGFPFELINEELEKRGCVIVTQEEFNQEMNKHQELSRTASAGKFKGGLADAGEETKKLHTAAHLLLAALRKVLGNHVVQKGSNITAERLRFDFSHPEKLTDEQKKEVERLVNEAIAKKLPIVCNEMTVEEAKAENAMGVFESRYGKKVKVYVAGTGDYIFSKEICGGPHVENTETLGKFIIKKEQSSSAGIRRIKAVLK
ncbi:alanine--tRNA ligase [Patescibacteria group bacterium]